MRIHFHKRRGMEIVLVIVMITLLASVGLAVLTVVTSEASRSRRLTRLEQSFTIAEAGINYYRWRLAHYPADYQDGTGAAGPYIHDFTDSTGTVIGRYELTITPPVSGSTITTIQSAGYLLSSPTTRKVITVRMGMASLTKYAVFGNSNLRFGEGTVTNGPIHSNGGIRFDGLANGLITSAQASYNDPDHTGNVEFGVHTHKNAPPGSGVNDTFRPLEAPNNAVQSRVDVFAGGRQFPVASIDFAGITSDLNILKGKAIGSNSYYGASGKEGYHVTLKTNGTMDIKIVNSQLRCQFRSGTGTCSNNANRNCTVNSDCSGSGTCLNWKDYGFCAADFNRTCTADSGCRRCINNTSNFCGQDSDCKVCSGNSSISCSSSTDCKVCSGNSSISCSINSDCSAQGAGTCTGSAGTCPNVPADTCAAATAGACTKSSFSIGTAAGSETAVATNAPFPSNGIIFLGDDVWIDGAINNARLTIVAAEESLADGMASIYINKDLTYTAPYDGTDAIGLIAQNNILVGYFSSNTIRIDAALIAQKGRVGRAYYGSGFTGSTTASNFQLSPAGSTLPNGGASETSCHQFRKRDSLTAFGSLGTYQRYGFAWVGNMFNCTVGDDNDSGYCARNLTFDANLTYAPPPDFPTSGIYQILSYDER